MQTGGFLNNRSFLRLHFYFENHPVPWCAKYHVTHILLIEIVTNTNTCGLLHNLCLMPNVPRLTNGYYTFSGIPQMVLMTKVDEACPDVMEDLQNIYITSYIKMKVRHDQLITWTFRSGLSHPP